MIQTIRASQLFALVPEQAAANRITQMKIPIRRMPEQPDYSLKLLELMVLTACIRITGARKMFEFGTFLGNTTLHMALNSPHDSMIWTLDADDRTLERLGLLETYSWRKQFPFEFEGTPVEYKVHILRGDSHIFEPGVLLGAMHLVLVDGDHGTAGVTIDSQNARALLRPRRNACIVWHDYSPECPEVKAHLDELSEDLPIFHVEDTKLAVFLESYGKCPLA